MLSKNRIKFVNALSLKKFRLERKKFLAEGPKVIPELYRHGLALHECYATEPIPSLPESNTVTVSEKELQKISQLTMPNKAVAVFHLPEPDPLPHSTNGLVLALDAIRDPGNLGTIIRLCDWFGIQHLICSPDTVDCYNPKVVQSTAGSLARVHIHYTDLNDFLQNPGKNTTVYGAFVKERNLYETSLQKPAVLVMGNEANGISKPVEKCISQKIAIPRFGRHQKAESLNVATATGILLSEFSRRGKI